MDHLENWKSTRAGPKEEGRERKKNIGFEEEKKRKTQTKPN